MLCLTLTMPLYCNYIALLLIVMEMLSSMVHVLPFGLVKQWLSLFLALRPLLKR